MATDSSGRFAETRFGMHASADAIAGATLVVSIFDHDRIATSHEPLGEVRRSKAAIGRTGVASVVANTVAAPAPLLRTTTTMIRARRRR